MERFDMQGGAAENTKTASGTAAATATQSAPGAGSQLIITGFSITFGVASTAAGTYQIRRAAGATVMRQGNLPIGNLTYIYEFKRPLVCGENESADIVVTGATTATVVVELYTVTRPVTQGALTLAAT